METAVLSQPTHLSVAELKDAGFYKALSLVDNGDQLVSDLHYIDYLANFNNKDASKLLLPIEDRRFKLTRGEITKLFFSHIEEKAEEVAVPVVNISLDVVDRMRESMVAMNKIRMRDIHNRVTSKIHDARSEYGEYEEMLFEALRMRDELRAVRESDPMAMVNKLIEGLPNTRWNFHYFSRYGHTIDFVSRFDIILKHHEPELGIHHDINCGKFKASFNTSSGNIRLYPFSGCVEMDDAITVQEDQGWDEPEHYIHPNVDTDGSICWGTADEEANEAILERDVLRLLTIIDALLPNYGKPAYLVINDFQELIDARDARLAREKYGQTPQKTEEVRETESNEFITEPEEDFSWSDEPRGDTDGNDND